MGHVKCPHCGTMMRQVSYHRAEDEDEKYCPVCDLTVMVPYHYEGKRAFMKDSPNKKEGA